MNCSRRQFITSSALGTAAALFPGIAFGRGRSRAEFTLLRGNVGIFTEQGGTIGWLVNDDGVAVVDSQFPDAAQLLLDGLRERTTRQIDVLINTHHHPDHVGGNTVLRPAAREIVAHTRSDENQRRVSRQRGNAAEQAFADTVFDASWSTEIGEETVRAVHYGPAHTGGDVAIVFEGANVVHLGDLFRSWLDRCARDDRTRPYGGYDLYLWPQW